MQGLEPTAISATLVSCNNQLTPANIRMLAGNFNRYRFSVYWLHLNDYRGHTTAFLGVTVFGSHLPPHECADFSERGWSSLWKVLVFLWNIFGIWPSGARTDEPHCTLLKLRRRIKRKNCCTGFLAIVLMLFWKIKFYLGSNVSFFYTATIVLSCGCSRISIRSHAFVASGNAYKYLSQYIDYNLSSWRWFSCKTLNHCHMSNYFSQFFFYKGGPPANTKEVNACYSNL